MKRRKKPKASSHVHERYPVESSGLYPYLLRFLEWFVSRFSCCATCLSDDIPAKLNFMVLGSKLTFCVAKVN